MQLLGKTINHVETNENLSCSDSIALDYIINPASLNFCHHHFSRLFNSGTRSLSLGIVNPFGAICLRKPVSRKYWLYVLALLCNWLLWQRRIDRFLFGVYNLGYYTVPSVRLLLLFVVGVHSLMAVTPPDVGRYLRVRLQSPPPQVSSRT